MTKQKELSLCYITKNDEDFFPACLKDMKGIADEILVADLGSNDSTCELAKQAGAVVYRPEWEDDFSKIRNFCMDHASGEWVLFLQANEMISSDQRKELKLLLRNPAAEGYLLEMDESRKNQIVSSPAQSLRLLRNRTIYRFRYRSFVYIPDEELYSIQNSVLRIKHRGEKGVEWQQNERLRLLQTDLKEHPQDGYVRYLEGLRLLNQGKYEESAVSLELARQAFAGGYLYVPHLYQCLGNCLLSLEKNTEAEQVLTEGSWLFPFYTDLLFLRAKLYRRIGRVGEALNDLETCQKVRKSLNACVPGPEIGISDIEEMLDEIKSGLNEER